MGIGRLYPIEYNNSILTRPGSIQMFRLPVPLYQRCLNTLIAPERHPEYDSKLTLRHRNFIVTKWWKNRLVRYFRFLLIWMSGSKGFHYSRNRLNRNTHVTYFEQKPKFDIFQDLIINPSSVKKEPRPDYLIVILF